MNVKIDVHEVNFESTQNRINEWSVPAIVKKDLRAFLEDLALGKVNKGKRISDATRAKYVHLLRISCEFFNKPINKINRKDVEEFEKSISAGKIKSYKKKPFTHSVMVDIRVALKIFLRWKLGREKTNALTDFIDTRDIKKTPDYLKESEIEKLYKHCKSFQEKYLIATLFDSGARAEEFLNIRYEDVEIPTKDQNFVKITLKEEYSKTAGRVISLYWPQSLEAVRDYIEQRKREGINANEAVYNGSYETMRFFLIRLGKRVLGRSINPHLFRHSSSTHYASKLNRQQLCYRYGWAFSSNMPDVYISRSGMNNKELDERFEGTEMGELKSQLSKETFERKKMKEDYEAKEREYASMFSHLKSELESLKKISV